MSETGYVPLRTQTLAYCGTGRGDINIFQDNVRNAETSIEHHVCREGAAAGEREGASAGGREGGFLLVWFFTKSFDVSQFKEISN